MGTKHFWRGELLFFTWYKCIIRIFIHTFNGIISNFWFIFSIIASCGVAGSLRNPRQRRDDEKTTRSRLERKKSDTCSQKILTYFIIDITTFLWTCLKTRIREDVFLRQCTEIYSLTTITIFNTRVRLFFIEFLEIDFVGHTAGH